MSLVHYIVPDLFLVALVDSCRAIKPFVTMVAVRKPPGGLPWTRTKEESSNPALLYKRKIS